MSHNLLIFGVCGIGVVCYNSSFNINNENVFSLKKFLENVSGIPKEEQVLRSGCKILQSQDSLSNLQAPLHFSLRTIGGKGGFGALLRSAGAKAGIKKKIGNDDCRDLNGRRIRHVKNEERLQEWYAEQLKKAPEEKEKKKKQKKINQEPTYNQIEDPSFSKQSKEIEENILASVEKGLEEARRLEQMQKEQVNVLPSKKRPKVMWDEFDIEEDILSDSCEMKKPLDTPAIEDNIISNNEKTNNTLEEINIPTKKENQIDLQNFSSAKELESLGLETLKMELKNRGLLCGGNLKERAERYSFINEIL